MNGYIDLAKIGLTSAVNDQLYFHFRLHIADRCIATVGFIAEVTLVIAELYSIFPCGHGDIGVSIAGEASPEEHYWPDISKKSINYAMNGDMSVSSVVSVIPPWTNCERIDGFITFQNFNVPYIVQNAHADSFKPVF
jgi:hypothetical protein